jgi:hypothetical protein
MRTKKQAAATTIDEDGAVTLAATQRGMLPHEFLAHIASGAPVRHTFQQPIFNSDGVQTGLRTQELDVYPDLEQRIDAAKASAPYFAPRLAAVAQLPAPKGSQFAALTDEQLDEQIRLLSDGDA